MHNQLMNRYGQIGENNPTYQKLLQELKDATKDIFTLCDQLTPEQVKVLDRYLIAFCRLERYQNLLFHRAGIL